MLQASYSDPHQDITVRLDEAEDGALDLYDEGAILLANLIFKIDYPRQILLMANILEHLVSNCGREILDAAKPGIVKAHKEFLKSAFKVQQAWRDADKERDERMREFEAALELARKSASVIANEG